MKDPFVVVGAGPAGLMAAGQAAQEGARVIVLEKKPRPARKLRITGKGRCNLTNTAELQDWLPRFGSTAPFLRPSFARFFNRELMEFFESLGVPLEVERGGRVFPKSGQATDIVDCLIAWAKGAGVTIRTNRTVTGLEAHQERIAGVVHRASDAASPHDSELERLAAGAVIVTTGGATYPATGSTGDGYVLAKTMGHRIVPIRPALVPLRVEPELLSRLQGLHLKNVRATLLVDGKKDQTQFGEIEFISSGMSGPIVLTLSKTAAETLETKSKVDLSIDLKPGLEAAKLDTRLIRDLRSRGKEDLQSILRGLLPAQLIPLCLQQCGLPGSKPGHQITTAERTRLRTWLKDFQIQIIGTGTMDEAIVTAGGVDTREVNPRTMESRLVSGLFFAGEVLDLCADTGGFNLQAAFSTGWMAGRSQKAVDRRQ